MTVVTRSRTAESATRKRSALFPAKSRPPIPRRARGSQPAIRFTKRALNNWIKQAGPIFDQSLALEMLNFMGDDVREGMQAIREKRLPSFPSAR